MCREGGWKILCLRSTALTTRNHRRVAGGGLALLKCGRHGLVRPIIVYSSVCRSVSQLHCVRRYYPTCKPLHMYAKTPPSRADQPCTTQHEPSNAALTQHPINPPTGLSLGEVDGRLGIIARLRLTSLRNNKKNMYATTTTDTNTKAPYIICLSRICRYV
jgi:hypothetical protein